jgi:hypothetical protein
MGKLFGSAIGGVVIAAMIAANSFVAVSTADAEPAFYGAKVYQAGNRNWKRGNWGRGNWNHGNWNNGHWNNSYWVGPAIGLGAGILLGSMLAAPRYYGPRYYYAPQYEAPSYRSPVFESRCAEAIAQHGENSAEARTHC